MAYNTSYYNKAIKDYTAQANKSAATQKKSVEADKQSQLKQSYVQRMQNQKTLNNNLARQGIRGGASETSNLNLATNYENNRNSINSAAQKSISDINKQTQENIFNYTQQTNAAKQEYLENRASEDRARKRQLADAKAARQRAATTKNLTAKYSTYYTLSGLRKSLKKAKTTEERAIIRARIGYLKKHKKKY